MAKSSNLNTHFPQYETAKEMYERICILTKPGGDFTVRNFVGVVKQMSPVSSVIVTTDLFSKEVIEHYTRKNLGLEVSSEDRELYETEERGGAQGDYSEGMQKKISNVIKCLQQFPNSKRAVITIPFSSAGSETADFEDKGQTKCVRELHFYIEDSKLECTGILRMQNANIFPKNIHFIAQVMTIVAGELGVEVGTYTHWITNLCRDRTAQHC